MKPHLHRFFVHPTQVCDGLIRITNPDARQIRTVLRLKQGDRLAVLDGSGVCYRGEIRKITKECVTAGISETVPVESEPGIHLTLAQGLPKGDRFGFIVQKGTELGISEFVAIITTRSVSRPSNLSTRQARWQRIAKEAAEQCGCGRVPLILGLQDFTEAIARLEDQDLTLIAWEEQSGKLLSDVLRARTDAKRVLLFIGPEGGFTREEVEAAVQAGAEPVSLGRRVLRTETAAVVASAIILNELDGHL